MWNKTVHDKREKKLRKQLSKAVIIRLFSLALALIVIGTIAACSRGDGMKAHLKETYAEHHEKIKSP